MRTWKPTLHSIYGFLGRGRQPEQTGPSPVAEIQRVMTAALGASGERRLIDMVWKIHVADDVRSLWYLRADLMAVLAAHYGEGEARDRLNQISQQFEGLLPRGMSSRYSPLGDPVNGRMCAPSTATDAS